MTIVFEFQMSGRTVTSKWDCVPLVGDRVDIDGSKGIVQSRRFEQRTPESDAHVSPAYPPIAHLIIEDCDDSP